MVPFSLVLVLVYDNNTVSFRSVGSWRMRSSLLYGTLLLSIPPPCKKFQSMCVVPAAARNATVRSFPCSSYLVQSSRWKSFKRFELMRWPLLLVIRLPREGQEWEYVLPCCLITCPCFLTAGVQEVIVSWLPAKCGAIQLPLRLTKSAAVSQAPGCKTAV